MDMLWFIAPECFDELLITVLCPISNHIYDSSTQLESKTQIEEIPYNNIMISVVARDFVHPQGTVVVWKEFLMPSLCHCNHHMKFLRSWNSSFGWDSLC